MLITIIFYILIIPLCTLMHEIGHGIAAVSSSSATAHVHLGHLSEPDKRSFNIGRLHFHLKWSYYGFCSTKGEMDKNQRIINLIGGPLVSLVMAIVFGILIPVVSNRDVQSLFSATAIFCAVSFLVTAIPIKYPLWMGSYYGHSSDGLQVLYLLRGKKMS